MGRNFAAGMSGGIAYVLADNRDEFALNCNQDMVDLDSIVSGEESAELLDLLQEHYRWTGSSVAAELMAHWDEAITRFVKVMPRDYKRVLAERQTHDPEIESTVHQEKTVQQGST